MNSDSFNTRHFVNKIRCAEPTIPLTLTGRQFSSFCVDPYGIKVTRYNNTDFARDFLGDRNTTYYSSRIPARMSVKTCVGQKSLQFISRDDFLN